MATVPIEIAAEIERVVQFIRKSKLLRTIAFGYREQGKTIAFVFPNKFAKLLVLIGIVVKTREVLRHGKSAEENST